MAEPLKFEVRKFVFTTRPTGAQIAELVWENDLGKYAVDITTAPNLNYTGTMQVGYATNRENYVVEFTRRVTA